MYLVFRAQFGDKHGNFGDTLVINIPGASHL